MGAGARRVRAERTFTRRPGGFTLIELMITLAVIAILSAIAYPAYRESVAKGRRVQAVNALAAGAQWLERFYAENYRYDQNTAGVAVTDATLFGGRFTQAPPSPDPASYTISLTSSANAMSITATRTGVMAGDRCGDYSINQLGVKSLANYDGTRFASAAAALTYCWK